MAVGLTQGAKQREMQGAYLSSLCSVPCQPSNNQGCNLKLIGGQGLQQQQRGKVKARLIQVIVEGVLGIRAEQTCFKRNGRNAVSSPASRVLHHPMPYGYTRPMETARSHKILHGPLNSLLERDRWRGETSPSRECPGRPRATDNMP